MQALHHGDRIDEVALAERAHDVRVQGSQVEALALQLLHEPLADLRLYGAGRPLDGRCHLHAVLVL